MRERHVKGRVEKGGEEGEGEKNQTIDKGQGRGVGGGSGDTRKDFRVNLGSITVRYVGGHSKASRGCVFSSVASRGSHRQSAVSEPAGGGGEGGSKGEACGGWEGGI